MNEEHNKKFIAIIKRQAKSLDIKLKNNNASENTRVSYARTYKFFMLFCEEHYKELTLENIREDDIYAFLEYKSENLDKQGDISISSSNSYISHLKKLFHHIARNSSEEISFEKLFEDIKLKSTPKIPKGINEKDFARIVSCANELSEKGDFVSVRNALLIKVLGFAGLRASEAISISLSSFSMKEQSGLYKIVFIGKGNKNRTSFIKMDVVNKELSTLKEIHKLDENSLIAVSKNNKTMSRIALNKMVNSFYRRCGVSVSGVHILRHTAAKNLLAAGVSIAVVQSILGHSSIQTTSIYANPNEEIVEKELSSL